MLAVTTRLWAASLAQETRDAPPPPTPGQFLIGGCGGQAGLGHCPVPQRPESAALR